VEILMTKILIYIISVLTLIVNVIFILVGVIFYLDGNLIFAIVIWALVVIEKIIVIYLLAQLNKYYNNFYENRNLPSGERVVILPEPTCLIFIGIIMAATLMVSLISYSIL